jgi:hypothetical protein
MKSKQKKYNSKSFFLILLSLSLTIQSCFGPSNIQTLKSKKTTVDLQVGDENISVILSSENEKDTSGIEVTLVDLGNMLMVETFDSEGRFLPTTQLISKEQKESYEISAPQLDADIEWVMRPIGTINNIDSLQERLLGATTLEMLNDFLAEYNYSKGVSILMPLTVINGETPQIKVYETPGLNTILILPENSVSSSYKVAAPKHIAPFVFVAIYIIGLAIPFVMLGTLSQNASVPNLVGEVWSLHQARDVAGAMHKKAKVYFSYNIENTTCFKQEDVGRVIDQNPPPDTKINAFDEIITVYVCNEKVDDPYGCNNPKLTQEEMMFCGVHLMNVKFNNSCQDPYSYSSETEIVFLGDQQVRFSYDSANGEIRDRQFNKINQNHYEAMTGDGATMGLSFFQDKIVFNLDWRQAVGSTGCIWEINFSKNE